MTMDEVPQTTKVLVVEDDYEYAAMLRVIFTGAGAGEFEYTHVDCLKEALLQLRHQSFDVILLDLSLPDCTGLDSFLQVQAQAPEVPVVVVTVHDDPDLAINAIRKGAQDYLVKGEINLNLLLRSLLYAVERHRVFVMLQHLSLKDDLTNLLNRRGFLSMAQHQIKIAQRAGWESMILFADLDGLKYINDTFGHPEGDRALRAVASILRNTFRASDLIARLGGDEFVVLAINASDTGVETIKMRLKQNINKHNEDLQEYDLSLSYGCVLLNSKKDITVEKMIAQADAALYQHKRNKRSS